MNGKIAYIKTQITKTVWQQFELPALKQSAIEKKSAIEIKMNGTEYDLSAFNWALQC